MKGRVHMLPYLLLGLAGGIVGVWGWCLLRAAANADRQWQVAFSEMSRLEAYRALLGDQHPE